MKNPYDVLKVGRRATHEAIRRARNRAAQIAHPDKGGSVEAMQEVNMAYDLLIDETRRERFDRTGQDSPLGKKSIESMAKEKIGVIFSTVLDKMEEADNPLRHTIVQFQQGLSQIDNGLTAANRLKRKIERAQRRLKAPPDSFLFTALAQKLSAVEQALEAAKLDREVCVKGLEILNSFSFEMEQIQTQTATFSGWTFSR